MNVSVQEFLGTSYNHGDYIKIINNLVLNEVLWEGKYETMDNYIPMHISKLSVHKWGIEKNGIVIYVNYKHIKDEDIVLY